MLLWELWDEPQQEGQMGTAAADSGSGGEGIACKKRISLKQIWTSEESTGFYVQTDDNYYRGHSWDKACNLLLILNIL